MKKQFMADDDFALLEQSLQEAVDFETGQRNDLRVTKLPPRPKPLTKKEIMQIRQDLRASQAVFAAFLNISIKTVQAWESGLRKPGGEALKLLEITKDRIEALFPRDYAANEAKTDAKERLKAKRAA